MSSPRVLIQIAIVGAQIFGKALAAAGKQAVQNAKHRPGMAEEAAGVRNADAITQTHKMTLDEAHLILNAKKGDSLTTVLKNYENLFKINSPSEAPKASASTPSPNATSTATGRRAAAAAAPIRYHSHYIQSKVVRARERIEAEMKIQQEAEDAQRSGTSSAEALPAPSETTTPPPPPPA
ncbi:hypothetical protein FRB94_013622 [Tulasnella sp. JGI-2019a]|nr:hypothetical protein FRB93_007640 [Tulasnella sp. JGI-2019a]KAG9008262.1 hypothetical protein FRB94_013622 [Tulasnella sp. JGI-2019a]KAG9026869.1 hypothetical protein FRB95_008355 [Tulasnella sp. JGI-2019a]